MDILKSKKFQAALAGVIVAAVGELGLELTADEIMTLLAPLMAYIVGQGVADHGKEAAKIEADQQ